MKDSFASDYHEETVWIWLRSGLVLFLHKVELDMYVNTEITNETCSHSRYPLISCSDLFFKPDCADDLESKRALEIGSTHLPPSFFRMMLGQFHGVSLFVGVKPQKELAFFIGRKRARNDDVTTRGKTMTNEHTTRMKNRSYSILNELFHYRFESSLNFDHTTK